MSYKTNPASSASDQVLSLRVATRFQKVALSDEPEEKSNSGRPPPRWKEWLDATQDGGKKLVSNPSPNPLSRQRHPQVSFSTALKNPHFRDKALEAFKRWMDKSQQKGKGETKPQGQPPDGSQTPEGTKESPESKKPQGETDQHGEAPKKSWKERLQGLGSKARDFVSNAPKEVKKFIEDDGFRRQTLQGVHKALVSAPEKFAKGVVNTVKHEVHEYKEASQGVASAIRGKKMTPGQKKAIKTVATHLAIGVAAAALTSSGPLAAAGALAKGMSRHIALKAVSRALGHLHVLSEIGHIGHGVEGLMSHLASTGNPQVMLFRYAEEASKGGEPDTDEVFGSFIIASVAKELENFDDDALDSSLSYLDEGEGQDPSESNEESEDPVDEGSGEGSGEGVVKIDLSNVDEIWFVKKNDEGSEKVASIDIISRVVRRYRG
jgi:hypothetical protein